MKNCNLICAALLVVVLSLACASGAFAQRYVDVPAGYATLETTIQADSANRVANPNTVYRLHRGNADSLYILGSTLTASGPVPVQIESAGPGAIPSLSIATLGDGTPISPMISAKANLRIKGVYIRGVNTLGGVTDRLIRIQKNGIRLELDSVQVDMSAQSFIRVDNSASGIFLKNCRVGNIYSDWANGRAVDNRGVVIDTLSVTGCSFYRLGQRAYRDGGGILKRGIFNHNTFVDIAGPVVSLGSDSSLVFTNNLIVNCGFLGDGISGTPKLVSILPLPSGQAAYVAHNVFYTDSVALRAAYPDTVRFFDWFADTLVTFMQNAGTDTTNIFSPVAFTLPPDNVPNAAKVDSIAHWYWTNLPASSVDASILRVDSGYVNLAYNTSAVAYTWGSDGKPVGATEWFGITVDAVTPIPGSALPTEYSVSQNYPNPFNPSTSINYALTRAGHVALVVYDLLGRQVTTLMDGTQQAGHYRATFDGRGISSGTYFYRLSVDGNLVGVRAMMLLK